MKQDANNIEKRPLNMNINNNLRFVDTGVDLDLPVLLRNGAVASVVSYKYDLYEMSSLNILHVKTANTI
jgi:hypothetical protein